MGRQFALSASFWYICLCIQGGTWSIVIKPVQVYLTLGTTKKPCTYKTLTSAETTMPKWNKNPIYNLLASFPWIRTENPNRQTCNVLVIQCLCNCCPDKRKERSSEIREDFCFSFFPPISWIQALDWKLHEFLDIRPRQNFWASCRCYKFSRSQQYSWSETSFWLFP